MTDRVRAIVVTLEQDTREDDAVELTRAIGRLRGVAAVQLGPVVDIKHWHARGGAPNTGADSEEELECLSCEEVVPRKKATLHLYQAHKKNVVVQELDKHTKAKRKAA